MLRFRSRASAWLRHTFGDRRIEGPAVHDQAGHDVAQPPLLLELCPAVGIPDDGLRDGEWPSDPDQVPGWLIKREQRCIAIGIGPFRYRTRREFERAVASCAANLEAPPMIVAPERPQTQTLPPVEAAQRFLAWLRSEGHVGVHQESVLTELYAEHCGTCLIEPHHDQTLRRHLGTLGGVDKYMKDVAKPGERRRRTTMWKIAPSLAHVVVEQRRIAA